jgi:signal transduction histidine kinase
MFREPTDLQRLLAAVVDRVVPSRDRARVCIEAHASALVLVDVPRIERVVANLLQNALKYAAGTPVVVRLETRESRARVSIIDSGPGLHDDDIASLFAKHRRGRQAGKRDGSGLGLYVSRKIVEAHGGRIAADSPEGRGAHFFFELPLYML